MTRAPASARGVWLVVAAQLAVVLLAFVRMSEAQTADQRPLRRVELEVGGGVLGGAALGEADARLQTGTPARPPVTLFRTDSRFAMSPTVHARAGVSLSRRVGLEAGVLVSRPELRTSVSGDSEGGPVITVVETVDQYHVDASLIVFVRELSLGRRTLPYLVAGGGYVRQLHEGLAAIEQGHSVHLGGGVKHWLTIRPRGWVSGVGLRADARVFLVSGGVTIADRRRPHAAFSGSAFVAF